MKRALLLLVASLALAFSASAQAAVDADLTRAAAEGKPVFLIVREGTGGGADLARKVATEAQGMVPGSLVMEMDRLDPANAAVVSRHRLAAVSVPLILVIGPNGVAAGGARPHLITAGKLAKLVPSPAKAAYMKALNDGKPTFLVFARAAMPTRAAALAVSATAVETLKGAGAVVPVDLDDPREAPFVAELQIDPKTPEPVTVVVTAKGMQTGTFLGVPMAKALVDATAVKSGGCAPGSCGPNGCK